MQEYTKIVEYVGRYVQVYCRVILFTYIQFVEHNHKSQEETQEERFSLLLFCSCLFSYCLYCVLFINMPRRKRADIGRRSQSNVRQATSRANRTNDKRATDNANSRIGMSGLRLRTIENEQEVNRSRMQRVRSRQTEQQRARHNEHERFRRRNAPVNLERAAFCYDPKIDYSDDKTVKIGEMSVVCPYCKALKYSGESSGLCCAGGKVKLPQLVPPPDPLRSLISGTSSDSIHFLTNIQKYNNCFQMTSFGATHIVQDNFMPTFKVIVTT